MRIEKAQVIKSQNTPAHFDVLQTLKENPQTNGVQRIKQFITHFFTFKLVY